ncbi:ATP-binding cassette sub- G member 2 [Geranomyces variabilis]|uniref:ATP-binding cassette sub- G member 2 n=1 Tax=Geranomyces variabilis TaxID=109894 RepID=A0AAD5TFK8_9FUNG|nr:ATP-binding cassette sub- G member 2 [Geranomyces variabilis]
MSTASSSDTKGSRPEQPLRLDSVSVTMPSIKHSVANADALPVKDTSSLSLSLPIYNEQRVTPENIANAGSLRWKDISYDVVVAKDKDEHGKPKSRTLLSGVSGQAQPGELVAIMGSSGAGKTTLLNCLTGRLGTGTLAGTITLDGKPRDPKSWKRAMAFVEQDDALYANLTVTETLRYAALLRLSSKKYTAKAKIAHADEVLESLRLTKAKDSYIGDGLTRGVSGGERKRVSIGQELVGAPRVLFLDEPTSGLDSNTSLALIENLKAEAEKTRRIVVMTIHQPSFEVISMCDKVILLSAGSTCYQGPVDDALAHFASLGYTCPPRKNPADFFLDILTINAATHAEDTARVQKFHQAYRELAERDQEKREPSSSPSSPVQSTTQLQTTEVNHDAEFSNNWFTEARLLNERAWKDVLRNRAVLIADITRTFVLIIIMGFVFFRLGKGQPSIQSRVGFLFMWPINQFFVTMQPVLTTFPLERVIMLRERSAGSYRVSTFYTAKALTTLIPNLIYSMVASSILYWMVGLTPDAGKFFIWLLTNALEIGAAVAFGFVISSAVPTVQLAMAIGPLIVVTFLIFAGQLIATTQIGWWFRWLHYLSPIGYAYSAHAQNELAGLDFTCEGAVGACTQTGDQVLQIYALDVVSKWLCIGVLVILNVWWFLMAYGILRVSSKPKTKM